MSLINAYREAAIESKRPLAGLLLEAARLRFGAKRLGFSEYIDFQLHRQDIGWASKSSFGGQRAQAVLEDILIDDYSKFLSLDKVTMYALLAGYNLPIPKVRATYRSLRPSVLRQLQTPADLAGYLAEPGCLPVYAKRAFGAYGRGNVLVSGLEGGQVVLGNGSREPLQVFCESLGDVGPLGWILQDPLKAHPEVKALTRSEKISGVRVHSFLAPGGTHIVKAIFKINVGVKDSDNFEHGNSGNMLGAVDVQTGRVIRAITGVGLNQVQNPTHPITSARIEGFVVPGWPSVLALVHEAQRAFPGFLCPGWDIALCADGPIILEVNGFGDIDLSQHAYRQGFFDDRLMALLRERRLDALMSSPANLSSRSDKNHRLGARKHHWPW